MPFLRWRLFRYIVPVNRLTKQEQLVLCIVLGLLLTGWAVKTYRAAHPPTGRDPGGGALKCKKSILTKRWS